MSPRGRAASVLAALALAGGVVGAAVAPGAGPGPAALAVDRPALTAASLPAPFLSAASSSATSVSAASLAAAVPAAASPLAVVPSAASPSAAVPSPAPSASTPPTTPAPRADRDGFAPSLAIQSSAGAAGDGAAAADAAAAARTPVSVAVPRIGVDTPLVGLGIAPDGSLQVPGRDQFDLAGWLTSSAVPGEAGPSVIAGHVDSTSGPAVFFRLHDLVAGDEVVVTLDDGSTAVFVVDAVERVSKGAFPTAEVYGPQPGPVLRLITCGGAFDRSTGHYEDNVIAFASLA